MVCQNQSIDDSEAPLAHDLRVLVRDRLKAGDSDTQVLDYLVARYGEFVLLRPRVTWHNAALWGIPPLGFAARKSWRCHRRGRRRRKLPAGGPRIFPPLKKRGSRKFCATRLMARVVRAVICTGKRPADCYIPGGGDRRQRLSRLYDAGKCAATFVSAAEIHLPRDYQTLIRPTARGNARRPTFPFRTGQGQLPLRDGQQGLETENER